MRMTSGMEESRGKFPPFVDKFSGWMRIKLKERRKENKKKERKEKMKEKRNGRKKRKWK